jgi:pyruvate kinase
LWGWIVTSRFHALQLKRSEAADLEKIFMTTKITTNDAYPGKKDIQGTLRKLKAIRADIVAGSTKSQLRIDEVHLKHRASARNLLHYLAFRRRDLRPLQIQLAKLGLSSLGRAESHVLTTVDAVLRVLHCLVNRTWQPPLQESAIIDFATGERLLSKHTDALLGPPPKERTVRVMVTMPSEAADDYSLVHNLLKQGMDCMRINCAHDDAAAWLRMIKNLRKAKRSLRRPCRVVMDLAGPKLRTGPLEPGPAVVRIHPRRDVYGRVTTPARVWLTSDTTPQPSPSPTSACLTLPSKWLAFLRTGERVIFIDARDASRSFKVVEVTDHGCWVESIKTTYIVPGLILHHERDIGKPEDRDGCIGELSPLENVIFLQQGDLLILTRDLKPGRPATYDSEGKILSPAVIGCTIPEVFDDVRVGEAIWFDDGKIGGIIEKVEKARVLVRITQGHLKAVKLRADKGINLPESNLRLAAMTAKDVDDLSFVVKHADVVELSFANSAKDV